MTEDEIRASILEEMYEYHWREQGVAARCLRFAGDHYTYRDNQRAHAFAAEWVRREHMGILKYFESEKRLRVIENNIYAEHEALVAEGKIAK